MSSRRVADHAVNHAANVQPIELHDMRRLKEFNDDAVGEVYPIHLSEEAIGISSSRPQLHREMEQLRPVRRYDFCLWIYALQGRQGQKTSLRALIGHEEVSHIQKEELVRL